MLQNVCPSELTQNSPIGSASNNRCIDQLTRKKERALSAALNTHANKTLHYSTLFLREENIIHFKKEMANLLETAVHGFQ